MLNISSDNRSIPNKRCDKVVSYHIRSVDLHQVKGFLVIIVYKVFTADWQCEGLFLACHLTFRSGRTSVVSLWTHKMMQRATSCHTKHIITLWYCYHIGMFLSITPPYSSHMCYPAFLMRVCVCLAPPFSVTRSPQQHVSPIPPQSWVFMKQRTVRLYLSSLTVDC